MITPWGNQTSQDLASQELRKALINSGEISIPRIAVCIPYNGNWSPEWTQKTYIPLITQPTNWCEKRPFLSRVPSISVARNSLVKQALDANCDYVLFLDTDHVVESPAHPNMAISSLHSVINKSKDKYSETYKDARIVSASYRAKQKTGFNYAMWMKVPDNTIIGFSPVTEWTGNWIKVDVIGFGFCLIDIMVFKEIPPPWFVWNEGGNPSEDFYFCELAKKYGFDTRVLTDVKLSHLGNLKVMWNGSVTTQDM